MRWKYSINPNFVNDEDIKKIKMAEKACEDYTLCIAIAPKILICILRGERFMNC